MALNLTIFAALMVFVGSIPNQFTLNTVPDGRGFSVLTDLNHKYATGRDTYEKMATKYFIENLIGKKFQQLTVVREVESKRSPQNIPHRRLECVCECGDVRAYALSSVVYGGTKSCGCARAKHPGNNTKHGAASRGATTPEYKTWRSMKGRCLKPSHYAYHNYGGRGVTICNRWLGEDGFQNFLADMGERPKGRYSLERIDNDGRYEPSNCKWATMAEQNRNHRNTIRLQYNGKIMCASELDRLLGFGKGVIARRLSLGWSLDVAIHAPYISRSNRTQQR